MLMVMMTMMMMACTYKREVSVVEVMNRVYCMSIYRAKNYVQILTSAPRSARPVVDYR